MKMKRTAFVDVLLGGIFFFTVGAAGVAFPMAWPQYRHDAMNTGRSDDLRGPQKPVLSWTYGVGTPAIGWGGTLYAGSGSMVRALTPTGALIWTYATGGSVHGSPGLNGWDSSIYVGSNDNKVYALNAEGSLKWSYATGYGMNSPTVDFWGKCYIGGDIYDGMSYEGKVYALNADGSLMWSYKTNRKVGESPAIGSDGTVYFGTSHTGGGGKITALTAGGALSWSHDIFYGVSSSPAIGADGTVYAGADNNRLYALSSDGSLSWTYDTGDDVNAPAIGADGTVYAGSDNGWLYALTSDGSISWVRITGGSVSPPAIDSGGTIYVGSGDNRLYALTSTNALLWTYVAGGNMGNTVIGPNHTLYVTSAGLLCFSEPEKLSILVRQGANDLNVYFWNSPDAGDWTQWDALKRNPSPLARDFWQIPIGNDGIGFTSIDINDPPDGRDDVALLVRQGANDLNLYCWNAPVVGDWNYWDALARNPSPLARDFWEIPIGNDGIGLTSIDMTEPPDGKDEIAILVREGGNDLNIYFWNAPVPGDWTYWDARFRNPNPLARDLWQIPVGNDGIGLTSIDISEPADGRNEIAILVREGANDLNIYFWNSPVVGDWSYWDAMARNPSPLARDFWQIPIGNDGIGLTSIDIDNDGMNDVALLVRQGVNDLNVYFWNAPVAGDWTMWDAMARNPSPLARDFWQIPIGNDGIGMTGIGMQ